MSSTSKLAPLTKVCDIDGRRESSICNNSINIKHKEELVIMHTYLKGSILLTTIVSNTSLVDSFSTSASVSATRIRGHANYGESSTPLHQKNAAIRSPLHLNMSAVESSRGSGIGIEFDLSKPSQSIPRKRSTSPIEILAVPKPQQIKIKKKKHKKQRYSDSQRLTKEEEITLTENVKELKSLIRIYDNLSAVKTSPNHLAWVPNKMYKEPTLPFENKPTEEEWAEAFNISVIQLRRKLHAGREARSRIVSSNIGLVLQIAKRYDSDLRRSVEGGGGNGVGTILTLNDLVQEGNLGLMEAAERFESEKGVRFATYAGYWIKQRIIRSITNNSRVIRLPAHGEFLRKF